MSDSSISIVDRTITNLEYDDSVFEKYTFQSVITKLEKPVGKGCPVHVINKLNGQLVYRTETDETSSIYVPNLKKYNKYTVIAIDIDDIYNSTVFDLNWDFTSNLGYNYSLAYYDISKLDNIQAILDYQKPTLSEDNGLVASVSLPFSTDGSQLTWSTSGSLRRDNIATIPAYFFNGSSTTSLTRGVCYQKLPFTFEAYFSVVEINGSLNQYLFYQNNTALNKSIGLFVDSSLNLVFERQEISSSTSFLRLQSLTNLSLNTNYHVALCYDGTTFYLFLNGVLQTTANDSVGYPFIDYSFSVGNQFIGNIGGIVISETSKYSSNFNILFEPVSYTKSVYNDPSDTFSQYVSLLIKNNKITPQGMVDDVAKNIRFSGNLTESSKNYYTILGEFVPTISTYTNAPLGNKNFCIELCFRLLNKGAYPTIFGNKSTVTEFNTNNWAFTASHSTYPDKYSFWVYNSTNYHLVYPCIYKEQIDIAIVREGTSLRFYVNGFLDSQVTIAAGLNLDSKVASYLSLGRDLSLNLYDLKLTIGHHRYSSDYTPKLIDIEDLDLLAAQYQYVNLPFKSTLLDNNTPVTLTPSNVILSSAKSINGTKSARFSGSASFTLGNCYLSKEKFSLEMFVYPLDTTTTQTLLNFYSGAQTFFKVGIRNGILSYYNGSVWTDTTYSLDYQKFNHIVVKREGTSLKILAEGSLIYTATISASLTTPLSIGVGSSGTSEYFDGYLNNLYIYKNYIKYQDTYTVPVEEIVTNPNIEPVVIVNSDTTVALDFENNLVDKVTGTNWNFKNNNNITEVNKIYGAKSLSTSVLGDGIYTTNTTISGMSNKFSVEFYLLVNKDQSQMSSLTGNSLPIFANYNNTALVNGFFITSPHETSYLTPFVFRNVNHNGSGLNNYYSAKIEPNTINKIQITYDGSATRLFKNDKLLNTFGGTYTHNYTSTYLMGMNGSPDSATKGLMDNVNIFNNVSRKVRDAELYEDSLIVDLAFDGENNSTTIKDNGTLGMLWSRTGTINLSTGRVLNGCSSLYANSGRLDSQTLTTPLGLLDFTLEFAFYNESAQGAWARYLMFGDNTTNGLLYISNNNTLPGIIVELHNGTAYDRIITTSSGTTPTNKWNKVRLTRKNGIFTLYLNDVFYDSSDKFTTFNITGNVIRLMANNLGTETVSGYMSYLKIYQGVAIEPEIPNGKVLLNFKNNIIDSYSTSVWTNTGTTYDQINSYEDYSVKFTGSNTNLKANNSEIFNFKNNFNINIDVIKTGSVNLYPCVFGAATTGWQTSGSKNPNISFHNSNTLNISYNNGTTEHSISTQAFNNNYYNYDLKRLKDTLFLTLNDVVKNSKNINGSITNIPFNEGSGTYIGTAGWSSSNSQNFTGNVDKFYSYNEDLTSELILYKQGSSVRVLTVEDDCYKLTTQTYTANENTTTFLDSSPSLKNFVAEINLYLKSDGLNSTGLVFRTKNDIVKQSNLGGNLGYYVLVNGNTLLLGKGTNTTTATPVTLGSISISSYANNSYHTLKVVAINSSIKVYIDNNLLIDVTDTTHDISTQFYLHYYITATGYSSKVKSVKIWDETQTNLLYDKNWKSKVDINQYLPTVHYPFETNLFDVGFSQLTQTTNGSFTTATVEGRKCILFSANNYIQITPDTRSLYRLTSDFYIEFDFYPIQDKYHVILSNGAPAESGNPNLCTLTLSNSIGSLANRVYVFNKGYVDPVTNGTLATSNTYTLNAWNNIKLYREADQLTFELNGVKTTYTYNGILDYQYNNFTRIGTPNYSATSNPEGYLDRFIMINGTYKVPTDYNENLVIDVDFKPTFKSYLFKDNSYKNVLHPSNIQNRNYVNGLYCCSFNGTDQFIQLGKQEMFNFRSDDFIMRIDFDWYGSTNLYGCLIANGNTTNAVMDFIMILGASNKLSIRATNAGVGQEIVSASDNIVIPNGFNKLVLIRSGQNLHIYLNDIFVITKSITSQFNLNYNNNTLIGKNIWDGADGFFKGNIYKIKAFRNTTDISLI